MDSPPDDGPCEVTITAPDRDWLQVFVRQLVEDRLAATGHLDNMNTTYRWHGEVHEAGESRVRLHTTFANVRAIASRAVDEHPFEVACVAAVAIEAGSPAYLDWIAASVQAST